MDKGSEMTIDEAPETARVLIVDDEKMNTILLRDLLETTGVTTATCLESPQAIRLALEFMPHLVLLDIMMPEIDGFELCEQFKAHPKLKDIPILFLTAYSDTELKVRAFDIGGADFITKPFHHGEVLSRVKLQLNLYFQQLKLQDYANRLERMVDERTRQLIHSDRLVSLGTMAAKILHEINNPLTSVLGQVQLLKGYWTRIRSGANSVDEYVPDIDESVSEIHSSALRIMGISDGLRQYARKGASVGGRHSTRVVDIVQSAVHLVQPRVRTQVKFDIDIDPDLNVYCDHQLLEQVFINLISNSSDAMGKTDGTISVHASLLDGMIRIDYADSGPGIPPEVGEKIFEPFFTTKDAAQGTGLGMMIIQEILRDHGGRIRLVSQGGPGAHFLVTLPPDDEAIDECATAQVAQMPGAISAGFSLGSFTS